MDACESSRFESTARRGELRATLPRSFYERPTLVVARELLGKILVHDSAAGTASGRIVETEAYVGPDDLACHASRGRTPRTDVMFGPPGRAYIYFIYGMYYCLNAVTEGEGYPAAVLIRAIEPLTGIDLMRARRHKTRRDRELANGPGKLCLALSIDRDLNRADLTSGPLRIEDDGSPRPRVETSPRIGVGYAGEWAAKPWRFTVKGSTFVSKRA